MNCKKTVISFAQFEEDIVILNALGDIDREKIFYIDVGANDAIWSSVTFLFYLFGGKGINIEPQIEYKKEYEKYRPRDTTLFIGISNNESEIEMRGSGQSATFDLKGKYAKGNARIVHVDTLESVCKRYVPDGQCIHVLKIDVEGYEKKVLEGMDFKRYRPWIICIESYEPGEEKECFSKWEDILIDNGYKCAYTRGVNRFYCCEEKGDVYRRLEGSVSLDIDYEILKMGDYESLINSKWYKFTLPIRIILSRLFGFFASNLR